MKRPFRTIGISLQIVVLGELLFAGLVLMYVLDSGARIFRYAGF